VNQPNNGSGAGGYPERSGARLDLAVVAIANLRARIAWMLERGEPRGREGL
jgi:hypothetical protein